MVKNLHANTGDKGLILGPERSPWLEKSPHSNEDLAQPQIKKEQNYKKEELTFVDTHQMSAIPPYDLCIFAHLICTTTHIHFIDEEEEAKKC